MHSQLPFEVIANTWQIDGLCWSDDGKRLFWRQKRLGESVHCAFDMATSTCEEAPAHLAAASSTYDTATLQADLGDVLEPRPSLDGHDLIFLKVQENWTQFFHHDLRQQETRQITQGQVEYSHPHWGDLAPSYVFIPGTTQIAAIGHTAANNALHLIDWVKGSVREFSSLKSFGSFGSLAASPDGQHIAVVAAATDKPPAVLLVEWQRDAFKQVSPPSPYAIALAKPRLISWTSQGGSEVSGWYYAPQNNIVPAPTIILVHDGPEKCVTPGWAAKALYFTSRGYGIFYVNYHGSTGFGQAFREALYGKWTSLECEDFVAAKTALVKAGLADSQRVGLWGGRFAGTSVLATLARHPNKFRAAVSVYPFYRLPDEEKGLPPSLRRRLSLFRGDHRIDVTALADNIKDPLLLVHGKRDPFAPWQTATQMSERLQANGTHCRLQLYDNLGKKFSDPTEWRHYYEQVLVFWDEHLGEPLGKHPFVDYSSELRLHRSATIRGLLMAISFLALILGILGIFLPLLPTTPFILLAAACYARSSPRFYNWLMNHPWMGPPLRRWRTTGSIPRRSKVLAISLIVLTIGWAILFLKLALVVRTILAVIGISVSIYLLRIPTRH